MRPSDEKDEEALLIWATSLLHAIGDSSGSEFINSSTHEAFSALLKTFNYDQVKSIFRRMDGLYEYDQSRKQFIRDKLTISVAMNAAATKAFLRSDWSGSVKFKNYGKEALFDVYIIPVHDPVLKLEPNLGNHIMFTDGYGLEDIVQKKSWGRQNPIF